MISNKAGYSAWFINRLLYIYRAELINENVKGEKVESAEIDDNRINHTEIKIRHIGGNISSKDPLIYDKNNAVIGVELGDIDKELTEQSKRHKGKAELFCSHFMLSLAPNEKADDFTWSAMVTRYMELIGYNELTKWTSVVHEDTANEHLHIVACRVKSNGTLVDDYKDYEKCCDAARTLEQEFGFTVHPNFDESFQKNRGRGKEKNTENEKKDHAIMIRNKLNELYRSKKPDTMSDFVTGLKTLGVSVMIVTNKDNQPTGIKYSLDGARWISGSTIKKTRFTWTALQEKEKISYVPARDNKVLGLSDTNSVDNEKTEYYSLLIHATDLHLKRMKASGIQYDVLERKEGYYKYKYIEVRLAHKKKVPSNNCEHDADDNLLMKLIKFILQLLFGKSTRSHIIEGVVGDDEYYPIHRAKPESEVKPIEILSFVEGDEYRDVLIKQLYSLTSFMFDKDFSWERILNRLINWEIIPE